MLPARDPQVDARANRGRVSPQIGIIGTSVRSTMASSEPEPPAVRPGHLDGSPVLIYRTLLGAPSEPWVATQSEHIPGYRAHYLGHRAGGGWVAGHPNATISSWGTPRMRLAAFLKGRDPVANRLIERLRPALIHAHFGPDGMFAAATARRFALPLVASIHGYEVTQVDSALSGRGGQMWVRHRGELFNEAALLLANSEFVRDHLVRMGAPSERVVVHHLGVDTNAFAPSDPAARQPGMVLFVGRLVAQKGILDAIRAVAALTAHDAAVTLTVVGEGPQRLEAESLARELGVAATFVGVQRHAEVRSAMARASVLCMPSTVSPTGQREALGLVAAEAQACGLPVVATHSGGLPEVVHHDEGGLLVPEGDVVALAAALDRIIADPVLSDRLGAGGRRHIETHFDLATQSAALAEHYRRVIGR